MTRTKDFQEAQEHFSWLKGRDPKFSAVEIIDLKPERFLEIYPIAGEACQVGSKAYALNPKQIEEFRAFWIERLGGFVGLDIAAGPNVDVVADLCDLDFAERHPGLIGRFGFIICGAVFEHVKQPFDAARSIMQMLKPGRYCRFGVPWVWGFHEYPGDYWRMSVSATRELFPGMEVLEWWYAGTNGRFGIKLPSADLERAAFQLPTASAGGGEPTSLGDLLSDRAMPYLTVGTLWRKPL